MGFREDIEKGIKKIVGHDINLEVPPNQKLGDFAFPCFELAKKQKKPPAEIANNINKKLKLDFLEKTEVKGAYLNFFIKKEKLIEDTLKQILKQKKKFGQVKQKKSKKIMVEYSAPNTNKPLHVGHLRNQAIGMSVSNLLEKTGNKVIKANLISDRGVHICQSMIAYKKWGKDEKPKIKSDHFVGDWYVKFHKNKTEDLEKETRHMLRLWEKGDKETRDLWKKMNSWAIEGIKETYKEFGSKFDTWFNESDFYNKAAPIIEEGLKKNVFKKDKEGKVVAKLEKTGLPDKVILREDGTSVYITNDLALTKHKFEKFKLDQSMWVVGSEQKMQFKQLFKIFELLGYSWAKNDCFHLSYGMVHLEGGKMKSREGKVVDADDLIESLRELAEKETKKRNPKLKPKELYLRSKKISLAAIKFYLLKSDSAKDMNFLVESSISFEGETGPYLQYSVARANSILKKTKVTKKIDYSLLVAEESYNFVKKLADYPNIVLESANQLKPHILANYLLDLAQTFNNFYHKEKVIQKDADLQKARILLLSCFKQVMQNGLDILDIETMDEM